MKLDIDCIRSVLIELEGFDMGFYGIESFSVSVEKYGENAVIYTFAKLTEADYVAAEIEMDESGVYHFTCAYCMKYAGHQLLDKIRDERRWGAVKKVLDGVKDYSLSAISAVAEGITSAAISAAFEKLPDGFPIIGN